MFLYYNTAISVIHGHNKLANPNYSIMPLLYKLSQNNNRQSKGFGKWYANAVMTSVVTTDQLAQIM
jgi:hypothetical protein